MAKRETLKIDVPFDDAVRAFLNTPPPPGDVTGSRKAVKPKARKRKAALTNDDSRILGDGRPSRGGRAVSNGRLVFQGQTERLRSAEAEGGEEAMSTVPKCPTCGSEMPWYARHSDGVQRYAGGPDTRVDYYRCDNTAPGIAKHHRFVRVMPDGDMEEYRLPWVVSQR